MPGSDSDADASPEGASPRAEAAAPPEGAGLGPRPTGDLFRDLLYVFEHRHGFCPCVGLGKSGRARMIGISNENDLKKVS